MVRPPDRPLRERRIRDVTWGDLEDLLLSIGTFLLLAVLVYVVGQNWILGVVQVAKDGGSESAWQLRAFLVVAPTAALAWLVVRYRSRARRRSA